MHVAEMMKTDVKAVRIDATVADAVVTLADAHVSGLPVVDGRGALVGVVTTTDILTAAAESESPRQRELLFERTLVRDLMTPKPLTIEPTATVHEAARQMLYLQVHRLFVEQDGELVGVISQTDVVQAVATARL